MVNYNTSAVDHVFAALADATRRAIVATLATRGEMTVSALARPFAISLPAVLKHLNVLEVAGLVAREKRGRSVYCRLEPRPLYDVRAWLDHYERFWNANLDRLEAYLEQQPCPRRAHTKTTTPASSSSATSTPRRRRSGARGPSRAR
jgi:DNA-binding transcriptional ArsR family regulator